MDKISLKFSTIMIIWLVCLSLAGCDALYRVLDKEGAEEKTLIGEVIPYKSNPVIEEVQSLLHLYGYNTGRIDGMLGLRTRNAIEQFQKDSGLKMTRFIDHATWEKLNVFVDQRLVVNRQLNIEFIQLLLKEAGHNPGKVDGKMGAKTKAAVLAFQEENGLKVDGKIGYKTLSALAQFMPDDSQLEQWKQVKTPP